MTAAIDLAAAVVRRWTAAGWRSYILAAALLTSAIAVIFTFAAPNPVTARFFFFSSAASYSPPSTSPSPPSSSHLSSISPLFGELSPPLDPVSSIDPLISTTITSPPPFLAPSPSSTGMKSSRDDLQVPPLQSQIPINSTTVTSTPPSLAAPPPLVGNSDANEVKASDGDLRAPPLQSEEPISSDSNELNSSSGDMNVPPLQSEIASNSTSVTSLPPFLAPSPSSPGNSDTNEVKSSGEDLKVPIISTAITSPPPILRPPPSPTGNSDANGVKSSSGDAKVPPLQPEIPISLMTATDRELMYANRQIDHAPIISDDPDLYAPLFRNVSVFKRSYELMERILKVYIYRDGQRPIFHTPLLRGIYASEGWFMKLMEENTKFVVKDPKKAHLFYLPYSARQLELALYNSDSHNLRPLAVFLKNYVDWISAKYPFWNRTRGADHFLVACHDWGPYTTKLHEELSKNTIKALCNADLSEGVFIRGKDVSLPETIIRNPKKLLRDLGGKLVSQRSILAFFAGNMHGRVRPILLDYWSGKDEDMKIYGPLPPRVAKKMSYIQHMKSSKFCICPMGYEVNSPRIVEAIYYECVPVIIADNFVLPFDEVLDWSAFSVVVAEKDIPKLKDILLGISLRKYVSMQGNVKRLQRHFLWHPRPVKYDIFHMILHSIWFNRLNQIQVHQ